MSTYEFYIDRKVTIWERDVYTIPADSRAEAFEKAKELFYDSEKWFTLEGDENEGDPIFEHTDTLYYTSIDMKVEENNGELTQELIFADTMEKITDNLEEVSSVEPVTVKTVFLDGVDLAF